MRIFNETKTEELETFDPEEGYLRADKLITEHEAIPERVIKSAKTCAEELKAQGREVEEIEGEFYLVTATYESGGKDVEKITGEIVPAADAWCEEEEIAVFVPYTQKEKALREIETLKKRLFESDYKAIKFAEGYLSEEEYAPTKAARQLMRDRINELEACTE